MKQYDIILFDLDGTITDSAIGITNSVMYALEKFQIQISDRTQLFRFVGPPLDYSFKTFYGFSEEEAKQAIGYYREYYTAKGIFENEVYDGVEKLLQDLKTAGRKVILATSKPELFAKQILEHFELLAYFDYVAGASMDETRNKKDEVIAYALKENRITDISKVLMVGDREYDILGAKKFGMDSMGVLFGYGSLKELQAAGADYLAETPEEIRKIILEKNA